MGLPCLDRRRFVRALAAAGITLPTLPSLAQSANVEESAGPRHLVLIELQGGNDGLNTLVPYADPAYRALRPRLGLARDAVATLDERVGFHPALAPLMGLWRRGDVAIVEGVGYPVPNRSHFRSIAIWETASDADQTLLDGWLAPVVRTLPARRGSGIKSLTFGANEGPLAGTSDSGVVLEDVERFVAQARGLPDRSVATRNPELAHVLAVEQLTRRAALEFSSKLGESPNVESVRRSSGLAPAASGETSMTMTAPPNHPRLVRQLDAVARLIVGDVGPQLWKVGLGSFDTHVNQLPRHELLMRELAQAITTFERTLRAAGRWNDVTLVTYSEFGRRANENGSGGTDHGTAAPHFVMGGSVRGGLYGAPTDLTALEAGDVRFTTDFRSVYRTLATDWFGQRIADAPYAGFERLSLFG